MYYERDLEWNKLVVSYSKRIDNPELLKELKHKLIITVKSNLLEIIF